MATGLQDNHSIHTKTTWPPNGFPTLDNTTSSNDHSSWTRRREMIDRTNQSTNQFNNSVPQRQIYAQQQSEPQIIPISGKIVNSISSQQLMKTTVPQKGNPAQRMSRVPGQPLELIRNGYYKEFLAQSLLKKSVQESCNQRKGNEALRDEEGPANKKVKLIQGRRNSNSDNNQYPGSSIRVFSRRPEYPHLDSTTRARERNKSLPPPPPLVKVSKSPSPRDIQNNHNQTSAASASRLESETQRAAQHIKDPSLRHLHANIRTITSKSTWELREAGNTPRQAGFTPPPTNTSSPRTTSPSRKPLDYQLGNTQRSTDVMTSVFREEKPRLQNIPISSGFNIGDKTTFNPIYSSNPGNAPKSQIIRDSIRHMSNAHEQNTPRLYDKRRTSSIDRGPRHEVIVIGDSPPLTDHQVKATFSTKPRILPRSFAFESEKSLRYHNFANPRHSRDVKDQQISEHNTKAQPGLRCNCLCTTCQSAHSLEKKSKPLTLARTFSRYSPPAYVPILISDLGSTKRGRFFSSDDVRNLHSSKYTKPLNCKNQECLQPLDTKQVYVQEVENEKSSFLQPKSEPKAESPSRKSVFTPAQLPSVTPRIDHPNTNKSNQNNFGYLSSLSGGSRRLSFPPEKYSYVENRKENPKIAPKRASSLGDEKQDQSFVSQIPNQPQEVEQDTEELKPYGGYAFDHDSLPIIVAVHSVGAKSNKAIMESTSDVPDLTLSKCSMSNITGMRSSVDAPPNMVGNISQDRSTKGLTVTTTTPCHSVGHATADEAEIISQRDDSDQNVNQVILPGAENLGVIQEHPRPTQSHERNQINETMRILGSLTCPVQPFIEVQQENTSTGQTKHVAAIDHPPPPDSKDETKQPSEDIDADVGTVEVSEEPVDHTVIAETTKKESIVQSLSEKILDTRKRIGQENIDWKKKLLCRLELVLTKKLRKAEMATGEKVTITIPRSTKEKPKILNKTQASSDKKRSREGEKCDGEIISKKKKKRHKFKKVLRLRKTTEEESLSDYELTIEETQESTESVCLE